MEDFDPKGTEAMSVTVHEMFSSLRRQGFSRGEAIQLTCTLIKAGSGR